MTLAQTRLNQHIEWAIESPEAADFADLWHWFDQAFQEVLPHDRLNFAAEAITQIAEVLQTLAGRYQTEITASTGEEPRMPLDIFTVFVQQSSTINFSSFIELPQSLPRIQAERRYCSEEDLDEIERSIVVDVEVEELIKLAEADLIEAAQSEEAVKDRVLAIAHEEDVLEWGATIARLLEQQNQPIPLLQLQRSLSMPLVQLWLGLLLNGFTIEQRGDFYDIDQVWITQH